MSLQPPLPRQSTAPLSRIPSRYFARAHCFLQAAVTHPSPRSHGWPLIPTSLSPVSSRGNVPLDHVSRYEMFALLVGAGGVAGKIVAGSASLVVLDEGHRVKNDKAQVRPVIFSIPGILLVFPFDG
eukprot:3033905-Rhodomonas_salina.1